VAIVVSLVSLAYHTARPHVYVLGRKRGTDVLRPLSEEHPNDETFEGLLIVRPEGRLFFLNADYVKEQIIALEKQHQPRVVVWDMSAVPDIEYSALQALIAGEKSLAELGTSLWLAGLNPGVLEMVRRAGFDEKLGRERMLFNAHAAIERYQAQKPTLSGAAQ
jgi:MFS superfamily sulfate permease-like transporter